MACETVETRSVSQENTANEAFLQHILALSYEEKVQLSNIIAEWSDKNVCKSENL